MNIVIILLGVSILLVILYMFTWGKRTDGKSVLNFSFFLYSDNEIDNFYDYISVYSKEIFDVLKDHPSRTFNPQLADIFITCFSNESNYPVFESQHVGRPKQKLTSEEMLEKCRYISKGPHLTFFHNSDNMSNKFVNIPYMARKDDDIIICPPAIENIIFRRGGYRNIIVSFKGKHNRLSSFDNIDYRNLIINKLQKSTNQNRHIRL
tara:strand:- start:223 stop:843 length:621 start_codon:yes stop_codon:yes gene_type:complete